MANLTCGSGGSNGLAIVTQINDNTADIAQNVIDIGLHATSIAQNTVDIATNLSAIDVNSANIASLANPAFIQFLPQSVAPSYLEGQLYVKDGGLKFQGRYSTVTQDIGDELGVDIINETGGNMLDGQVCRYDHVASGKPAVDLAIATSFESASGIGVLTHDVASGADGRLTTFGTVSGVDLSAFSNGAIIYLSSTVAGGFTDVAPEYTSRIGIVFNNDSVNGILFVNPEANVALPTGVAYHNQVATVPISISTAVTPFDAYTEAKAKIIQLDGTSGLKLPDNGTYELSALAVFSGITATNSARSIDLILVVDGVPSTTRFPVPVGRNAEEASDSFSMVFSGVKDTIITLAYTSDTIAETINSDTVSYSVKSVYFGD